MVRVGVALNRISPYHNSRAEPKHRAWAEPFRLGFVRALLLRCPLAKGGMTSYNSFFLSEELLGASGPREGGTGRSRTAGRRSLAAAGERVGPTMRLVPSDEVIRASFGGYESVLYGGTSGKFASSRLFQLRTTFRCWNYQGSNYLLLW